MKATASYVNGFVSQYEQLTTHYDSERRAVWCYMHASPRPCYTPTLLANLKDFQHSVAAHISDPDCNSKAPIQYLVAASHVPEVFNLGGDLNLFVQLIEARNRKALFQYARACIDVLYMNAVSLEVPLTTIALVQGNALGGGFEAALSCNVMIAERSAQMGLPEILFNLFPGMGAYSLLARRLGMSAAEKFILSGNIYDAAELYEMGIVDVLAEDGEGVQTVHDYIRRNGRARNGIQAIQQVRQRYNPLRYDELLDIVSIWVDAALRLESKDLRMMERLVRAQNKRTGVEEPVIEERHNVA
jgi:DSF synthase